MLLQCTTLAKKIEKALKIYECKFGLTYLEHFFPSNAARMLQYSQQDGWWVIKKLLANIKHSKNISNNQKIKKAAQFEFSLLQETTFLSSIVSLHSDLFITCPYVLRLWLHFLQIGSFSIFLEAKKNMKLKR